MAPLLSQQDDFVNQTSMVETLITEAGHECLFLPKFYCELNPIEMVSQLLLTILNNANSGAGANIIIKSTPKPILWRLKNKQSKFSILARSMSFRDLLIGLGGLLMHTRRG